MAISRDNEVFFFVFFKSPFLLELTSILYFPDTYLHLASWWGHLAGLANGLQTEMKYATCRMRQVREGDLSTFPF